MENKKISKKDQLIIGRKVRAMEEAGYTHEEAMKQIEKEMLGNQYNKTFKEER